MFLPCTDLRSDQGRIEVDLLETDHHLVCGQNSGDEAAENSNQGHQTTCLEWR